MAQLMDHIDYLSKEIGPRPAGTEEEQQAALYITEQFQKETGFPANIEEFSSSSNLEYAQAVLAGVVVLVTLLAIIFPVLAIPAFILAAAATALFALEAFDNSVLSRFLSRGASQNVVAKYQPSFSEEGVRPPHVRKIILVAHYDTGRVTPPFISKLESMLPLGLVCVVGLIAASFFLLIRIFIASGGGMGLLILNVLSILALIVCLVPVVKAVMLRVAPYNEGANNNASGTAALIEVARRISRGSVSEADLAREASDDVYIHGEEAARQAGLIPEGAQIRYEAEQLVPPAELGEYDEQERLLAAKAAIAALTGKPVEPHLYGSVADKLVNSRAEEKNFDPDVIYASSESADGNQPEEQSYAQGQQSNDPAGWPIVPPMPNVGYETYGDSDGFHNAPQWFVAAQQNARKPEGDSTGEVKVQRSKYTEAFDNAERERIEREEQMRAEEAARQAQIEALRLAREEEARRAEEEAAAASALASAHESLFAGDGYARDRQDDDLQGPADQVIGTYEDAQPSVPEDAAVEQREPQIETPRIDVAPISQEEAEDEVGRHALVSELPPIQAEPEPSVTTNPSRSGILRSLRENVPSLSGIIAPVDSSTPTRRFARHATPKNIPSVIEAPSTPSNTAIGNDAESIERSLQSSTIAMPPINYSSEMPAQGEIEEAPRGNASDVSVPRSRSGNLLNRLRGEKEEELSDTPQQWLDVDEDFEARNVGKARGSWESFRDDKYFDDDEVESFGSGDEPSSNRRWNGGAYSREQIGRVDMRSGEDSEADTPIVSEPVEQDDGRSLSEEIEQIYHFRNPQFNSEIWFVAIGSDGLGHDGAKAFIEEHRNELRGSMIIEVESLGAGVLSVASEEGSVRKVTASSRVKRFARNATSATGIALDTVSLVGTDSISSTVQKAGFQSMHLFGAEEGRPALKGSADDVLENIDELLLDENVNYVFELLKN